MLNNEARQNLQLIKEMARQIWGRNCEFEEIDIKDSPYPEFELPMRLYQRIYVGIYYNRSALDIGIKQDEKYTLLGKFTKKEVLRGMKAMEPENLLNNFNILDEVARDLISNSQI